MLEEMIGYKKRVENLLTDRKNVDWKKELRMFKTKLIHLQIERIIHLLVTLAVGLSTLITCIATVIYPSFLFAALDLIFIILFLFYILHYRKLENTIQSFYKLLDNLKKQV